MITITPLSFFANKPRKLRRMQYKQKAVRVSDLLVDAVNGGVQESFINEKRIEYEIRALAATITRFMEQTDQWLTATHALNTAVKGCDGSVLLDDTPGFTGEKTAGPNFNSIRGFDVVDEIKAAVDKACKGPIVSCADILAVAARDSVVILGGPHFNYKVLLGRRDARTASKNAANTRFPSLFSNFSQLLSNFQSHGLNLKDLVALSGGHTIGFAQCKNFRSRIYNDTNIDPKFAASLKGVCPQSGRDYNLAPMDGTPTRVDTIYYRNLLSQRGLFHSDQELFKGDGSQSDKLVKLYSTNPIAFAKGFKHSMIKMGNMRPLTGTQGEIRLNCRRVN